ncbi:MAG: VWA domain-containing protein [Rhodopila sp.]
MAERLEPGVAGRLCSVLDEGVVTLQRDGLSRTLPTRFGVVALDEGSADDEKPPAALLDRLAFHLDLTEVSIREIDDPPWTARSLAAARDLYRQAYAAAAANPTPASHTTVLAVPARSPVMAGEGPPPTPLAGATVPDANSEPAAASASAVGDDSKSWMAGPSPATTVGDGSGPSPAVTLLDTAESDPASLPEPGHSPTPSDPTEALCGAALTLGIDSIRAPLFALRAARAVAALDQRTYLSDADLGTAGRLVFISRATRFPPPPQDQQEQPEPPPPEDQPQNEDEVVIPDQPLADVVLDAVAAALPPDLLAKLLEQDGRGQARATGRAGQTKPSTRRGRPIGTRQGEPKNGNRLHLLETLKAAAPWQILRRRTAGNRPARFEVRRDDLRIIRFRQRIGSTTIFAVDASGSAAMQRLGEAKGAVELLLADCYVRRDQVALIAFRGTGAQILLPPTGSLTRARRSLAGLPGGGPTPLAAGIDAAVALADQVKRTGRTPVITFLTDGRANIGRDGQGGRPKAEAEALAAGRALRAAGIAALFVDTSPRPNPFARKLADEMHAKYVPLPYADPAALSRAVRATAA